VPPTFPGRLTLATFHASEGSYIQLHPALCHEWDENAQNFQPFRLNHQDAVKDMLDVLRTKDFLADTSPGLLWGAQSALGFRAPPYRMTRAERQRLVCKILVYVPEDKKHGWDDEMRRRVRTFFRV
jgi:hypothetical protein